MGNVLKEKEFNLLYEPWILVKTADNKTLKLSLLEVFKQASNIQQLAGELPTQDIAVLRLLLAIMYGAFVNEAIEDAEDALKLWKELWSLGKFPYEIIENYLKQYEDRFWLFHPKYPFYQVAGFNESLKAYREKNKKKDNGKESIKSIPRLIGDLSQSDNSLRLFPGRTGDAQKFLEYDEAARWLIHLNGFDDNAAKNPTPKFVGYLGLLGLIYAKGGNLFETLLLNFVLMNQQNEVVGDNKLQARAYWEKPVCMTVENLIAQPFAQKDLLTLQSRRILLKRSNTGLVSGYLVTMGDYFDPDAGMLNEQMTVWTKDEEVGFKPKRHRPDKQIWRDFGSLICTSSSNSNLDSGVVHWLKYLEKEKVVPVKLLNMCTTGIFYKLNASTWQITDFVNDTLQMNGMVLGQLGNTWVQEIINALAATEDGVRTLGWLAADIITSAGESGEEGSSKTKKQKASYNAREMCYSKLDPAFRKWLREINPDTDNVDEKIPEWKSIAKKIINSEGRNLMDKCSDNVLVGYIKTVKDKKGNTTEKDVNLFVAFNRFVSGLTKTLG